MSIRGGGLHPGVWEWIRTRTSAASDWPLARLREAKGASSVSVVLPARNEERTVAPIVDMISRELGEAGLVDEVVVIDSRSTDATAAVAAAAGARVLGQDDVLAHLPKMDGKGDAMWKGLAATSGDIVAFVDADLVHCPREFVLGLLGPLLEQPGLQLVKGFYHRPLVSQTGEDPDGGGRVTELVARPLLNLHWPALSGFVQPLAGEYAGRRAALEHVPFVTGYGVEIGLLIDLYEAAGLAGLAQVDLGERRHRHQDTHALARMSAQIMLTAFARLMRRGDLAPTARPSTTLTQFTRGHGPYLARNADVTDVSVPERPPLASLRLGAAATSARSR